MCVHVNCSLLNVLMGICLNLVVFVLQTSQASSKKGKFIKNLSIRLRRHFKPYAVVSRRHVVIIKCVRVLYTFCEPKSLCVLVYQQRYNAVCIYVHVLQYLH